MLPKGARKNKFMQYHKYEYNLDVQNEVENLSTWYEFGIPKWGNLKEKVYIEQPFCYVFRGDEDEIQTLKRALHGLRARPCIKEKISN